MGSTIIDPKSPAGSILDPWEARPGGTGVDPWDIAG